MAGRRRRGEIDAKVRFLSCEPLLGPITLSPVSPTPDWLIVGGESGPGFRPFLPEHYEPLIHQCVRGGIPVFFKQMSGATKRTMPPIPVSYEHFKQFPKEAGQ